MIRSDNTFNIRRIATHTVGLSGYCFSLYLAQLLQWEGNLLEGGAIGLLAFSSLMLPSILNIERRSSNLGVFGTYDDNFWVALALAIAVGSAFFWFFDATSNPFAVGYFLVLFGGVGITPLIGKRFAS